MPTAVRTSNGAFSLGDSIRSAADADTDTNTDTQGWAGAS